MSMNVSRYILKVLKKHPMLLNVMGAIHFHPLPNNKGLVFYTSGNLHKGWIWVKQGWGNKYNIRYITSNRGVVKEQKGVSEEDLANEICNKVGQSSLILDYFIDMYLIK